MHVRIAVLALVVLALTGTVVAQPSKTSKERLSDKASDEQRVDNCRVPPDRRGPLARPDCVVTLAPDTARKTSAPAAR